MSTPAINSPAVIEAARKQITDMVGHVRKHPDDLMLCHGDSMAVSGYLYALLDFDLIDDELFAQLCDERSAAFKEAKPLPVTPESN